MKKYWIIVLLLVVIIAQVAYARGFLQIALGKKYHGYGDSFEHGCSQREFQVKPFIYDNKEYIIITRYGTSAFAVVPK